tara:strand:+ start:403 stop:573 length:171 start_codon:yes stop_codon:yes gene_type:complete
MKEKVIIFIFVLIISQSSDHFLRNVIKKPLNNNISTINIENADDLWHYFSRFPVNN